MSFAQLRGLGLVLRPASTAIDAELDGFLARLLPATVGSGQQGQSSGGSTVGVG